MVALQVVPCVEYLEEDSLVDIQLRIVRRLRLVTVQEVERDEEGNLVVFGVRDGNVLRCAQHHFFVDNGQHVEQLVVGHHLLAVQNVQEAPVHLGGEGIHARAVEYDGGDGIERVVGHRGV